MTTKKIFAAALAALFMTAFNACTKEETPAAPEVPGTDETLVEMTFTAVQAAGESATGPDAEPAQAAVKSTFDGTQIGWETDDLVAIYDGTAKRQFTVESVENGVATLKGMVSPDATEFYAVFPYSAAGDALPTQEGQISLPVVKLVRKGRIFRCGAACFPAGLTKAAAAGEAVSGHEGRIDVHALGQTGILRQHAGQRSAAVLAQEQIAPLTDDLTGYVDRFKHGNPS